MSYRKGLVVIGTFYILVYGWMLLRARFVPYVMDNNESFSSFWHAANMWNFGLSSTFGLSDEAFSPFVAAHPVVEPHNGNFPRLFSLLLYVFGARSMELQIVITTFTVGLLSVFLAYRFFSTVGNSLFGGITTLVLMTDYLLFAQWQVNSWRVWASVFFFSTLLSVHALGNARNRWLWRMLALLNASCLFYLELVFGAFVVCLAALYALWLYRRSIRSIIWSWLPLGMGACAAVGILLAQKIAYFGLQGAMEDSFLTYVARNAANSDTLKSRVHAFYGGRTDIAFWQNISDATQFRSLSSFINSFFHYHLELFTPIFALIVLIVVCGWALGLLPGRLFTKNTSQGEQGLWGRIAGSPLQAGNWGRLSASRRARYVFDFGMFGSSCLLFLLAVGHGSLVMGIPQAGRFWVPTAARGAIALGGTLVACAWLRRLARLGWLGGQPLPSGRVYSAAGFLVVLALIVRSPGVFYAQSYRPLWYDTLSLVLPLQLGRGLTVAAAVLAVAMTLYGSHRVLLARCGGPIPGVLRFLLCGAAAYGIAYWLIPGYVVSGYLVRYAPFAVYVVDAAVGLVIYCAWLWALGSAQGLAGLADRLRRPVSSETFRGRTFAELTLFVSRKFCSVASKPVLAAGLSISLVAFLVMWWAHVQVAYASAMPDGVFNRLRVALQSPPLKGASFVVNNYPALAAAYTGDWAYQDGNGAVTALDRFRLTASGYSFRQYSTPYLWMADRNTNPAYQRPDYFLCMEPEDMGSLVSKLSTKEEVKRCSQDPAVEGAIDGTTGNKLVARDQSGWDAWAIVKLDWHYPPYLLPEPQFGAHRLVGFTLTRTSAGVGVQAYYQYAQQEGQPEDDSIVRLYRSDASGRLTLLQQNNDDAPFLISAKDLADVKVSVTPRSIDRPGREYFAGVDYFDDPPLLAPSSFAVQPQSQTSAGLSWIPVRGATEIRIERRDQPDGAFRQEGVVDADAQPQFTSKGLQPGATYSWRIEACDSSSCSPYSIVKSAVVSMNPLARPEGIFLLGSGFKDAAASSDQWPRVTDGTATLWLYPNVDGPLAVTLVLAEPAALRSESGPDIDIALDQKIVPPGDWTVQQSDVGSYSVEFSDEFALVGQPVELTISSPTYVPALTLPGSRDTATTGVELSAVDFESGGRPLALLDGLPVPTCSQPTASSDTVARQCR